MSAIFIRLNRFWTLAMVFAAGVLACAYLPDDAFKNVTQELISLFGLMMAGVLPTMVLTANVLRAGNLSVKKLTVYRDALRQQMVIWIGLFLISFSACLFIIIGKMMNWSMMLTIPLTSFGFRDLALDPIRYLNMLIVMALALISFRAISVGNGIISLLRLSAELAINEAQAQEDARHRAAEASLAGMRERKGYGDYVDLAQ